MKKHLLSLFFIFITTILFAGENYFEINIEQNGNQIPVINNEYRIQKDSFVIVIRMKKPIGVLINSSFEDSTYEAAKNGISIENLKGYRQTAYAESLENEDREILIGTEGCSNWYYDNEKENRFDIVKNEDKTIVCFRSVRSLFLVEEKESILLKDVEKPLFLTFIYTEWEDSSFNKQIEFQRDWLKINWK